MKFFVSIFSSVILSCAVLAQTINEKLIILSEFQEYKSNKNEKIASNILQNLKTSLENAGYTVKVTNKTTLSDKLNEAQLENAFLLIDGFYKVSEDGSLSIYSQTYHPQKKEMIDALFVSKEIPELEGLKLDPNEMKTPPETIINDFIQKQNTRIRSNKKRAERRENIEEGVVATGLSKDKEFPIAKENIESASAEVFKILAEKEIRITTASNVITDKEKQPASVTVIDHDQIKHSGARTLNELLTIYVPGFFTVEDQDDTIAGFRGFASDNNAKVLLLINGHNMNTEWFWGPPDSIINGLNLDYIDRIEVIRGPGSVTLGQGALLGVVNIITKKVDTHSGTFLSGSSGANNYNKLTIQAGAEGKELTDLKSFFQISTSRYHGQKFRSEGWAKAKEYEGNESNYNIQDGRTIFVDSEKVKDSDLVLGTLGDQTLVTRRNLASGFARLKKSDHDVALGNIQYKGLEFTGFYSRQIRDMYNFYRDRNVYENSVKTGNITYSHDVGEKLSLKFKSYYTMDDLILHSQQGLILGGTREYRYGGSVIANFKEVPKNNNFAIGIEYRKYDMGQKDANNNNFIINNSGEDLLKDVNVNNRYVYPDTITVASLFFEDFYKLSDKWDLFGAFRYDKHPGWGTNISPRFGTIFSPSSSLRMRLSYQEGFRGVVGVSYAGGFQGDGHLRVENFKNIESAAIPNAFGDDGRPISFYSGVPETKPEKMRSYELALSYKFSSSFKMESIFFYNNLRNIIDVGVLYCDKPDENGLNGCVMPRLGSDVPGDWNGYWFYKNAAGEIRQGGIELGFNYTTKNLTFGLSHSLVKIITASASQFDSIYLTNDINNFHFKGYPENVTRLYTIYRPIEKWSLSLNYLFYPLWYSPRGNRVEGNHLVNVSTYYNILENLEAGLVIKNLLGHKNLYPMISNAGGQDLSDGTPSVELRTYWLNLTYKF